MKFEQRVPADMAPHLRDEGFQFWFVVHGDQNWMNLFREVAAWYDENFDDGDRERVTVYGRAILFKDEETAFQFKLRWG